MSDIFNGRGAPLAKLEPIFTTIDNQQA